MSRHHHHAEKQTRLGGDPRARLAGRGAALYALRSGGQTRSASPAPAVSGRHEQPSTRSHLQGLSSSAPSHTRSRA